MIRIENLQKYYNKGKKNEQYVLKGVSIELGETGLVCLLGESGCGKTTLLNTVGGLDDFQGGSITVDDTTVRKYDPRRMEPVRNDHFGYIFQNYYLLEDHTVAYNVKLALNRFDLSEEEKDARVDYVLGILGMSKYKKKPVSKLSGGQQQRVSIARALVKSPDIILADEPTGNLDEENTLRTMSILKNISKTCLVLLVTHERRIAEFFADRIIEIKDGVIMRDVDNTTADAYERSDDANIYLKELDCHSIADDYADFRIYCGKGQTPPPVELSIAWRDGKLYVQNRSDCDMIVEGTASGVRMLDAKRPKFDVQEMDKITYDLERPQDTRAAKLPVREIWRMAVENLHILGKKQAFLIVILLVTAVLLSITIAQVADSVLVNEDNFVTTDEHYMQLTFGKVSSIRSDEQQTQILKYERAYLSDGSYGTMTYLPDCRIYVYGQGFYHMRSMSEYLSGYSFVDVDLLDEDTLLYGTMPANRDEIVVDVSVIKSWMASGGAITSSYKTVESFLNTDLVSGSNKHSFTIVGICDSGHTNIYARRTLMLYIGSDGEEIMSLDELQTTAEGYEEVSLGEYEILVRAKVLSNMAILDENAYIGGTMTFDGDSDTVYTIAGTFTDDIDADYVLSDAGISHMIELAVFNAKECMLYNEDTSGNAQIEKTLAGYAEDDKIYRTAFTLDITVPHEDEVAAYVEAHSVEVDAKMLIAAVLVVFSIIMIYFTMKSNAISRSEELTVYRLLGIAKGSILKAYVLEMLLVTTYTSLPAVILTCAVIKYVAAIPSLGIDLTFPLWCMLPLLVAIYLVHALISLLPVYGILSKPPAALAVKE